LVITKIIGDYNKEMNQYQVTILVVDDIQANLYLLTKILGEQGYTVHCFVNGTLALKSIEVDPPDLILLDIKMPHPNGYEVCKRLKASEQTQNIPVIFISALDEVMDKIKAFSVGAVDYITKPFQPEEILLRVKNHLALRALQKSLEHKNDQLQHEIVIRRQAEEDLQRLNEKLEQRVEERTKDLQTSKQQLAQAYDETLVGWACALELRDNETQGHSRRVADMTVFLARAMGIGEDELIHIHRGALLHDIGKMAIPDNILQKDGPLTAEEWQVMYKHPLYAYQMLLPISYLRPALEIPYCHHERWDGNGYPRGLKGEQIPLSSRIFTVVDVWDALRSNRSYHEAWSEEKVRAHIKRHAGSHFDPQVVEAFLKNC
jgi:putative two-component system response regulator